MPGLFETKMVKIGSLFVTKMAEKPYPFSRTYRYSPYKEVTTPQASRLEWLFNV